MNRPGGASDSAEEHRILIVQSSGEIDDLRLEAPPHRCRPCLPSPRYRSLSLDTRGILRPLHRPALIIRRIVMVRLIRPCMSLDCQDAGWAGLGWRAFVRPINRVERQRQDWKISGSGGICQPASSVLGCRQTTFLDEMRLAAKLRLIDQEELVKTAAVCPATSGGVSSPSLRVACWKKLS